jgi:hypothetical protein
MTQRIRLSKPLLVGSSFWRSPAPRALTPTRSCAAGPVRRWPEQYRKFRLSKAGWRGSGSCANSSREKASPRRSSQRTLHPWVKACQARPFCAIFRPEPTPSRCRASGSTPVRLRPFSSLQGRRPSSRSNHCAAGRAQAATTSSATLSMYGQFRRIGPRNIFPP